MWSRASHPLHPSATPQQMRISPAHSSWRVSRKQERQQERALDHRFGTQEIQQMSISFLLSDIFGYCALRLSERVVALAVFPHLIFQALPPDKASFGMGFCRKSLRSTGPYSPRILSTYDPSSHPPDCSAWERIRINCSHILVNALKPMCLSLW